MNIFVLTLFIIVGYFSFLWCKNKCKQCSGSPQERGNNGTRPPQTAPQAEAQTEQERQEERRFHILTNVVHKKAVAKIENDQEHIKLPHEEEISYRSLQSDYDEEAPPELKEDTIELKTDITISASSPHRLSSWRRQQSTDSMGKNSDRIIGASDRENSTGSLYSPKTCAICLEKYEAGDDICWSKNESCPHAYHLDCMVGWLMNNDDCPLCREKYLVEQDEQ